jgi:hypothetical protein
MPVAAAPFVLAVIGKIILILIGIGVVIGFVLALALVRRR